MTFNIAFVLFPDFEELDFVGIAATVRSHRALIGDAAYLSVANSRR